MRTWSPHGVDDWYIEAAPKHYWCHTIYITKTRAEYIACTIEFFLHDMDIPETLATNNTTAVARMLVEALSNPLPVLPFNSLGTERLRAIKKYLNYLYVSFQTKRQIRCTVKFQPQHLPLYSKKPILSQHIKGYRNSTNK